MSQGKPLYDQSGNQTRDLLRYSRLFFILFSHFLLIYVGFGGGLLRLGSWIGFLGLGSWIGFLGLGFSVNGVWGLCCGAFKAFWCLGCLCKLRRITFGENFASESWLLGMALVTSLVQL